MKRNIAAIFYYSCNIALILLVLVWIGASLTTDANNVTAVYGQDDVTLPAYRAAIFGIPANGLVQTEGEADLSVTGAHPVRYCLRFLGIPLKTKVVTVTVVDMEAPVLEMDDGVICFSRVNEDWTYPTYQVSDNYDSKEDIKVSIEGEADSSKEGIYNAKLKACDTSDNCVMRNLTMVVGAASDQDFDPKRFDLYALDSHQVLLEPEGGLDSAYAELYWMGDSNILNLGMYNGVPDNRVMARYAMAPETFDKPLTYRNVVQRWNAEEGVALLKPKRLILMMGEAEAGSGNPLKFAEDYGECVDRLLKANPDMKLYISAILPIREKDSEAAATQEQINRANYCLMQMCYEKKLPMICADAWLKDDSGYGYPDYYLEDGFHLSASHFPAYTDYVRQCLVK